MTVSIKIHFDVEGVDPALVDPIEIGELLLDLYTEERTHNPGIRYFEPAENFLEAEWVT